MGGEEPMRGIVHDSNTLEETIRVSIRLRPLNDKESAKNDSSDWECINNNSVVFRSTLPDRSMFPQTYTFDRVFGCDSTTKQVYEEGAKEVALSVVNGINSTIFAYGQTSSGKTYTMNGVTEYSVADIYDYIEKHQDREFVLKFSAIEIYNEAVRDLLSFESVPLRLLDDPEKGTVVEKLIEETLKDRGHLQELLSFCQVQRKIGETSLNETSSRSHQILRLTIESTARKFQKSGTSSSLTATVNFVDLAGSERASQTMSAGTRLKEGCHINRSLLALGTVIRKLSKGRNGHVPYRDSKLTRILQNSLGGNGRTAIICTMSPARIHVEQSRNTLLFATCAKAVSTNAHVNVVVSDKALVKQLQRELARLETEMKNFKPLPGKGDSTALLKEKELVIEQMDKEIRELTRQRDLAQYRIENLLYSVGEDMIFKQSENIVQTVPDLVDLDADVDLDLDLHSEDSSLKTFGTFYGQEENSPHKVDPLFSFSDEDNFLLDSSTPELAGPDPYNDWEEIAKRVHANYEDSCKDVQCIELEEPKETLNENGNLSLARLEDSEEKMVSISGTNQVVFPQRKNTEIITFDKDFTYSGFVPKAAETQKTLNCIVNIYPSERSLSAKETTKSGFQNSKLARSKSCLTVLLTLPPPSSWIEKAEMDQKPQIVGSVVNFSGPEEGGWRKRGLRCGNMDTMDSQSVCSHSSEAKTLQIIDEDDNDNTSVVNFSPEKKGKGKARIRKRSGSRLGMIWKKDEPEESTQEFYMEEAQDFESDPEWILEFQDQQREIIELWDACNVPLAHRSYFFILFKGDPSDAVYMEVELRRLFFMREAISRSTDVSGRNAITQASSLKALNREREMLARRIKKKFTVKERDELYEKWGIDLKTKQRSIQLTRMLWSRTKDMEHIQESAALVAKLIGFVDSDQVSREMFGLSFSLQSLHQSSFSRRRNLSLPF